MHLARQNAHLLRLFNPLRHPVSSISVKSKGRLLNVEVRERRERPLGLEESLANDMKKNWGVMRLGTRRGITGHSI